MIGPVGEHATDVHALDALFVQNASSFSSADGTITLHGVARATIYFSDRPRREVGHVAVARFVMLWDEPGESFAEHPPHGVLSFVDDARKVVPPPDAVVILHAARLDDDALSYEVELLHGELPDVAGPCSLFVDVFDRPLEPTGPTDDARRRRGGPRAG